MIERYLRFKCPGDFAYWTDPSSNTVYYSQPRIVGSLTWPAEVVLIRSLKALDFDPYMKTMAVYPQLSTMGRGMTRNHLRMTVNVHDIGLTAAAMVPPVRCTELNGDGVINVQPANSWITTRASPNVDLSTQGAHLHRLYLMAVFRLTAINVPGGVSKRGAGHNIGALLVKKDGQIIAGALNTGAYPHTVRHAESNMLQVYTRVGHVVPPECYVYTTLKPCDMCAAMLAEVASTCTVIYQQNDPGTIGNIMPLGGIRRIDTMGVKPLHLYDATLVKTGGLDLSIKQARASKSGLPLTQFVDTSAMLDLMQSTHRGLDRKAQRYTSGIAKRPEVVAVLKHIGENFNIAVNDPAPPPPPTVAGFDDDDFWSKAFDEYDEQNP